MDYVILIWGFYEIVENTCLPECSGLQTDKQDRKNHGFGIKNNEKHRCQSWLKSINLDNVRLSYSGKNIKIVVNDSGINRNIPELKGKIGEAL